MTTLYAKLKQAAASSIDYKAIGKTYTPMLKQKTKELKQSAKLLEEEQPVEKTANEALEVLMEIQEYIEHVKKQQAAAQPKPVVKQAFDLKSALVTIQTQVLPLPKQLVDAFNHHTPKREVDFGHANKLEEGDEDYTKMLMAKLQHAELMAHAGQQHL